MPKTYTAPDLVSVHFVRNDKNHNVFEFVHEPALTDKELRQARKAIAAELNFRQRVRREKKAAA